MNSRDRGPDALLIGAPKAGTSALHAALAGHPQVFASPVKEPKYYLCGDAPPPAYCGPGDAHSQQEWIWRRTDYLSLFDAAPPGTVRIESTPFYLYDADARRRIAEDLPDAKLIVVVRDPVDRAYSNWMHLWVDGLEPSPDFVTACLAEGDRIAAGWAPFWHYLRLGRYGEQLADLLGRVDGDRVLVLRYRDLIDDQALTLDRVSRFLGIDEGKVTAIPPDNSRVYVRPGLRTTVLGRAVRAGAAAGAFAPPRIWRAASRPLLTALQHGGEAARPKLAAEQRQRLVERFADDIGLLEELTGQSFTEWRSASARGSFHERRAGS